MADNLYESASDTMLAEIVREAESLLAAQLQAAVAADQRALTFAGLLTAAVAAMLGAIASLGGKVAWPVVAVATLLGVAAALALWSARPTTWSFAGNFPGEWEEDIIGQREARISLAEMALHYDRRTNANAGRMARAATAMRASMIFTALALVAALIWSWLHVLT